ncbi:hypothetical protein L7F22_010144 [Adiantum nelumboides]|nr:hypothetical protein [Adiantum nelumboides]
MSTPSSLADMIGNPFHAFIPIMLTLIVCVLFSKTWVDASGTLARDKPMKLKEQQMVMPGHRDLNLQKELRRYITTAASFSGLWIGALIVFADLMGVFGRGLEFKWQ